MIELLLVRHGATEWNLAQKLQGQTDIHLSPTGVQQARGLREAVAEWEPELVVTSTLARTAETAAAMGVRADYADADLSEMSLGTWEGRVIPELHQEDPEQYWAWRSGQLTPSGAETFDELCVRVERALARVVTRFAGDAAPTGTTENQSSSATSSGNRRFGRRRALVVCHGGVLRASIKVLTGIDPGSLMPIDPGSATIVQLRDLAPATREGASSVGPTTGDAPAPSAGSSSVGPTAGFAPAPSAGSSDSAPKLDENGPGPSKNAANPDALNRTRWDARLQRMNWVPADRL